MINGSSFPLIDIEDGVTSCAVGIMFLMAALASAIALGVNFLDSAGSFYQRTSIQMAAALLLVMFSLLGGLYVSRGFQTILLDSRKEKHTDQE